MSDDIKVGDLVETKDECTIHIKTKLKGEVYKVDKLFGKDVAYFRTRIGFLLQFHSS
jgi:hypothetical protein